ncbi:MAG TPA: hypothetical protein VFB21_12015 [Chthonomonadaceae bacterium]|nr:hypothetical protein [Chthonomonadaceae bacterium]
MPGETTIALAEATRSADRVSLLTARTLFDSKANQKVSWPDTAVGRALRSGGVLIVGTGQGLFRSQEGSRQPRAAADPPGASPISRCP